MLISTKQFIASQFIVSQFIVIIFLIGTSSSKQLNERFPGHPNPSSCFDKNGKFICARCIDGTIISKYQVCDEVFDCPDLSDECPCRHRQWRFKNRIPEICNSIFINKKYNLDSVCNGVEEMIYGPDEYDDYYRPMLNGSDERYCRVKRKIIGEAFKCPINNITSTANYNRYSNNVGIFCDGKVDCISKDDECSNECLMMKLSSSNSSTLMLIFLKVCFPFINYINSNSTFVQFDISNNKTHKNIVDENNEFEHQIQCQYKMPIMMGNRQNFTLVFVHHGINCSFVDNYQESLDFLCDIKDVDCPWLYRCNDQNKKIENSKVCDYVNDCGDFSDEMNCSNETHIYCDSGEPLFIPKRKVKDYVDDCSDRSDECGFFESIPSDMFANGFYEFYRSGDFFRTYVWFLAIGIIFCNAVVTWNHFRKINKISSKKSVEYCNTLLLINLSVSDSLIGFAFLILGVKSVQFSGIFCNVYLQWITSLTCKMIYILTMISSETSISIMCLLTGLRLYVVYRPFKSNNLNTNLIRFLCILAWITASIMAIYPILGIRLNNGFFIESNPFIESDLLGISEI